MSDESRYDMLKEMVEACSWWDSVKKIFIFSFLITLDLLVFPVFLGRIKMSFPSSSKPDTTLVLCWETGLYYFHSQTRRLGNVCQLNIAERSSRSRNMEMLPSETIFKVQQTCAADHKV